MTFTFAAQDHLPRSPSGGHHTPHNTAWPTKQLASPPFRYSPSFLLIPLSFPSLASLLHAALLFFGSVNLSFLYLHLSEVLFPFLTSLVLLTSSFVLSLLSLNFLSSLPFFHLPSFLLNSTFLLSVSFLHLLSPLLFFPRFPFSKTPFTLLPLIHLPCCLALYRTLLFLLISPFFPRPPFSSRLPFILPFHFFILKIATPPYLSFPFFLPSYPLFPHKVIRALLFDLSFSLTLPFFPRPNPFTTPYALLLSSPIHSLSYSACYAYLTSLSFFISIDLPSSLHSQLAISFFPHLLYPTSHSSFLLITLCLPYPSSLTLSHHRSTPSYSSSGLISFCSTFPYTAFALFPLSVVIMSLRLNLVSSPCPSWNLPHYRVLSFSWGLYRSSSNV